MAKSGGVVASEGPFGCGGRDDVGAVDVRISEKGFIRKRNWLTKRLKTTGVGK